MPTDFGGIAIGPSPCDQGTTRMGIAGFGHGPLPGLRTAAGFLWDQPPAFLQWPRVLEARQVAEFSHGGDGHGELDATQGLERFDDRRYPPGFDLVVECLLESAQAFRVFIESP